MEVKRADSLGDVISFKPDVVYVDPVVFDEVTEKMSMDDFRAVLLKAREVYDEKVSKDKEDGIRPAYLTYRSQVLKSYIRPFLDNLDIVYRRSRTKKGSKGEKEKVSVRKISPEDIERAKLYYDHNFDLSILNDAEPYREGTSVILDYDFKAPEVPDLDFLSQSDDDLFESFNEILFPNSEM